MTTFDQTLFDYSGTRLLESFLDNQTDGKLMICHENMSTPEALDGFRLIPLDITRNGILIEWDQKYRKKCEQQTIFWNKRAWQWYRKNLSLRLALETQFGPDIDWIIWVDSDCEILADISIEFLQETMEGAAVSYFKGTRSYTETGVMMFNLRSKLGSARDFIDHMGQCYDSGEFMKLVRWDDCWVFDHIRKSFPAKMFLDKGGKHDRKLRILDFVPFGKFIHHHKGIHSRSGVR